jgi:ribosomal-protein-alanine N-acetyltransferase
MRNSATSFKTGIEPLFRAGRAEDQAVVRKILTESNLSFHERAENGAVAAVPMGSILVHLLELNGEVLGVLQWRDLGKEAEILDIAVPAKHRRRGCGLRLLQRFVVSARERNARDIFLEVRESNLAAIGLYRKVGFSPAARRPSYYQHPEEAALLFHLKIAG